MKKFLLITLVLIVSVLLFAGCGRDNNDDADPPITTTTDTETPATTDVDDTTQDDTEEPADPTPTDNRRTYVNLFTGDQGNFDPHFPAPGSNNEIMQQIFDRLHDVTPDGVVWHLATGYSASEDALEWTFNLREGVVWSNGQPFTAHDVVFSFNERARQSPFLMIFVAQIADVVALDDYTVQFTLSEPYAPFFYLVSLIFIASEYAVTSYGDDAAMNPIGTGPYMLCHDTPINISQSYSLVRNPLYWGAPPQIERINYSIVTDSVTAILAFEAGQVHRIGVPATNWRSIYESGLWQTHEIEGPTHTYIMMNTEQAPFDDVRVRQAMNYAVNREEIILLSFDGIGTPATIIANPNVVFGAVVPDNARDYNPERARELFEEAGVDDLGVLLITAGARIPEVLQQQLRRVGVNFTIEMTDIGVIHEAHASGDFGFSLGSGGLVDDFFVYMFMLHSGFVGASGPRYNNPEVDRLFALALTQIDRAEREATYAELLRIVNEDAPYVPIMHPTSLIAADRDLHFTGEPGDPRVATWEWRN